MNKMCSTLIPYNGMATGINGPASLIKIGCPKLTLPMLYKLLINRLPTGNDII